VQQRCPDKKALANTRDPFTSASIGGHSVCSNIPCFHVRSREEEERSVGLLSLKIAFLLVNPKKKNPKQKTTASSNGDFTASEAKVGNIQTCQLFLPLFGLLLLLVGAFRHFENLFPRSFTILRLLLS